MYLEFLEDDELVELEENDLYDGHHQQLHCAHLPQHCAERYEHGGRREITFDYTNKNTNVKWTSEIYVGIEGMGVDHEGNGGDMSPRIWSRGR